MEKVYSDGKKYFEDLISAIESAKDSIDFEVYIFEDDSLGRRVFEALARASLRGVQVRMIVDGIGSRKWAFKYYGEDREDKIQLRVFRPLPWPFSRFYLPFIFHILYTLQLLWYINRRTHKKLIIIDGTKFFTGSFNIFKEALSWKECGVQVLLSDTSEIKASFLHSWHIAKAHPRFRSFGERRKLYREYKDSDRIWTNFKLKDRRRNNSKLEEMIRSAQSRIWLSQAYFLPTIGILKALLEKSKEGVDVRLVQSRYSDVMLVRWANIYYYRELITSGVKIYEYLPSILHSKIVLIDNKVKVGSSNLDHRSLSRDLELDIWLEEKGSVRGIEEIFKESFDESDVVQTTSLDKIGFLRMLRARVILLFKAWL